MSHIFLSFAEEDLETARRLYERITAAGYPVWFSRESLLVGQKWEDEIERAIQKSLGFIALISTNSVDKRGHAQTELQLALKVLKKVPANQVYLFPVRLGNVQSQVPQLEELHWLDISKDEEKELAKLLRALSTIPGLVAVPPTTQPKKQANKQSRKQPKKQPKQQTSKAPPHELLTFESMADVFRAVLERIAPATPESGAVNAFYVTLKTKHPGVKLTDELLKKYPEEVQFVFEHRYKDLVCRAESFSVALWFSGEETVITIPYKAITEITEPRARIRIA